MRLAYFVGCLFVGVALAYAAGRLGGSADTWRAIAVSGWIGLLVANEDRFVRWWRNRRLRRYLNEKPIAHRTDETPPGT